MSTTSDNFFSSNLKHWRGIRSQAEAATILGLKSQAIYQKYEKGTIPRPKVVASIAKTIGCEVSNLFEENGLRNILKPGNVTNVRPAPLVHTRRVPVVSWAMAGADPSHGNPGDLANQIDEYIEGVATRDMNAYGLIVQGPSMEPAFPAGVRIVAAPNDEARNGDYVVARLRDTGDAFFKRIRFTGPDGEIVILESLNPDHKPIERPKGAFRFIHPVIECRVNPRMVKI